MTDPTAKHVEPMFRVSKRRKILRKKPDPEDDESETPGLQSSTLEPKTGTQYDIAETEASLTEGASMAEILRKRKLAKSRRIGLEFSNTSGSSHHNDERSVETVALADEKQPPKEIGVNRFAPQMGQVTDVLDKHMIAYIDSKIVQLREGAITSGNSSHVWDPASQASEAAAGVAQGSRQPAGLGKLQEIDLGPDATLQNIARTEAATRRLVDGQTPELEGANTPQKVRLGKNGKPLRRRNRRNSDDVKRDKLVEEVLKESKLDLYEGVEEGQKADEDQDQAADDIIAEKFRREFMEAIASRNIRRANPAPTGASKGAKTEEKPKGPKLGGSRSARAAMRAREEAAKKK